MAKKIQDSAVEQFEQLLSQIKQKGNEKAEPDIKKLEDQLEKLKQEGGYTLEKLMKENSVQKAIDAIYVLAIKKAEDKDKDGAMTMAQDILRTMTQRPAFEPDDFKKACYALYSLVLHGRDVFNAVKLIEQIYNTYERFADALSTMIKNTTEQTARTEIEDALQKMADTACVTIRSIVELVHTREVVETGIRLLTYIAFGGQDSPYLYIVNLFEAYKRPASSTELLEIKKGVKAVSVKAEELKKSVWFILMYSKGFRTYVPAPANEEENGNGDEKNLNDADLYRFIIHSVALLKNNIVKEDFDYLLQLLVFVSERVVGVYLDDVIDAFNAYRDYGNADVMRKYISYLAELGYKCSCDDGRRKAAYEKIHTILKEMLTDEKISATTKVWVRMNLLNFDDSHYRAKLEDRDPITIYKQFCEVASSDSFYAEKVMFEDIYTNVKMYHDGKTLYEEIIDKIRNAVGPFGDNKGIAGTIDTMVDFIITNTETLCAPGKGGNRLQGIRFITDIAKAIINNREETNDKGKKEYLTNQENVKKAIDAIVTIIGDDAGEIQKNGIDCIYEIGMYHFSNRPLSEYAGQVLKEKMNSGYRNVATYTYVLANPDQLDPDSKIMRASAISVNAMEMQPFECKLDRHIADIRNTLCGEIKEGQKDVIIKIGIKALADIIGASEKYIIAKRSSEMEAKAIEQKETIANRVFAALYKVVNSQLIELKDAFAPFIRIYNTGSVWGNTAIECLKKLADNKKIPKEQITGAMVALYCKVTKLDNKFGEIPGFVKDSILEMDTKEKREIMFKQLNSLPLAEVGFQSDVDTRLDLIYEVYEQNNDAMKEVGKAVEDFCVTHEDDAKTLDKEEEKRSNVGENDDRRDSSGKVVMTNVKCLRVLSGARISALLGELENMITEVDSDNPEEESENLKAQKELRNELTEIKERILTGKTLKQYMVYKAFPKSMEGENVSPANCDKEEGKKLYQESTDSGKIQILNLYPRNVGINTSAEVISEVKGIISRNQTDTYILETAFVLVHELLDFPDEVTSDDINEIIKIEENILCCYPEYKVDSKTHKVVTDEKKKIEFLRKNLPLYAASCKYEYNDELYDDASILLTQEQVYAMWNFIYDFAMDEKRACTALLNIACDVLKPIIGSLTMEEKSVCNNKYDIMEKQLFKWFRM